MFTGSNISEILVLTVQIYILFLHSKISEVAVSYERVDIASRTTSKCLRCYLFQAVRKRTAIKHNFGSGFFPFNDDQIKDVDIFISCLMTIATKLNALTSSMMSYSQDVISSWWAVLINNYQLLISINSSCVKLYLRMRTK